VQPYSAALVVKVAEPDRDAGGIFDEPVVRALSRARAASLHLRSSTETTSRKPNGRRSSRGVVVGALGMPVQSVRKSAIARIWQRLVAAGRGRELLVTEPCRVAAALADVGPARPPATSCGAECLVKARVNGTLAGRMAA
jgi:hypothetical protein